KTLEEPSGSCLFLLICHDKKRLLPTIISRCQQWSITPPAVSESMQWLQQKGVIVNESFLKLAHYSPVTAMHMAKESEFQHYEKLERQFVDFLIQADSDYVSLCQTIQAATLRNL
ncbi:DNA polymerase III subunit delta', partial [Vibrio vulnificus]